MKPRFASVPVIASLAALAACSGDIDEQWDLDHDRIIAVRADKPGLMPGEKTELVGLLGKKNPTDDPMNLERFPVEERPPILAGVLLPMSLAQTVTSENGKWFVTAPSAELIAAARAELMIPADRPVPMQVGTQFGETLAAITTINLGVSMENPTIGSPTVDGATAPAGTEIVVGTLVDVRLDVTLAEEIDVNWLTSVGQMHDFDLPKAYLRVEAGDPTMGQLAVVIRDRKGGVAWQVWSMRAQ